MGPSLVIGLHGNLAWQLYPIASSQNDHLLAVRVADAQLSLYPTAAGADCTGLHIGLALGTVNGKPQTGVSLIVANTDVSLDQSAAFDGFAQVIADARILRYPLKRDPVGLTVGQGLEGEPKEAATAAERKCGKQSDYQYDDPDQWRAAAGRWRWRLGTKAFKLFCV